MPPPTVTASPRRRSSRGSLNTRRRRDAGRRRRRTVVLVALSLLAIVGVVRLLPLAQRAVNDLSLPLNYASIIREQAAEKNLDPALVAGVIYAETKFLPRTSSAGAEGPMQLMPQTALYLARRTHGTAFRVADLNTPQVNIAYGCYYLRYLLNEFGGNRVAALAAYNGGDTNVHAWITRAQSQGHRFGVADIPFPETRDYVQRVLQARKNYRHTYASQLGYS